MFRLHRLREIFGLGTRLPDGTGNRPALLAPPQPAQPVCVIGDIHGMSGLLDAMLAKVADQPQADTARIIFTGDLIDRGPQSAAVLRRVAGLCQSGSGRHICLMGNHERMLLDFLTDPARWGKRWISAGGAETLISYSITARINAATEAARFVALADALRAALPDGTVNWLTGLPLYWQEGNLGVVHAGADPALALADQPAATLLWGHPKFLKTPRKDSLWVAHGHNIVPHVQVANGRIAVDTGAYRTQRLSAMWFDSQGARVLHVGNSNP